jgi:ATP-dependent DNA helicase DinG
MASALELLGPDGPFARELGGYEERTGQREMAQAVERTLVEDRVLLCEAGTGTGKTLAYLLPAVLSGRKVIISTATRALQEQIYFKDLPLVARALGTNPRATLMKGLGNYLCRRRFEELRKSAVALEPGRGRTLDLVAKWVEESESGDLGELASLPEDDPVRLAVASSSETRLGPACAHYDACFVTRMRREAEDARIVIVNHHLFFADLALRGAHPGRVLPDYDAVVFDEAHQLEDIATEFFGLRVTAAQLRRALADAERALRLAGALDPLFTGGGGLVPAAESAVDRLFAEIMTLVPSGDGRVTLERDAWAGPLQERWLEVDRALEAVEASAAVARGRVESARPPNAGTLVDALSATARRMETARERMAAIIDGGAGRITWVEKGPRGGALSSSPVDLSWVLKERVFESVPAVVLTSATLATRARRSEREGESKGPFGYVRARLGLAGDAIRVDELVVESPFDFPKQALFYTPRDLPPPRSDDFIDAAAERVAALVSLTGGGCFVLTTSLRSMRAFHERLRAHVPRERLLLQGQAPKATLLGRFRALSDAVLVATASFWEGVDVPGQALRLVVLEKIPFQVPTDPIVRARSEALESEGGNPFIDLHVPAAAIALKQGFGRLVRTRRDVGIVALLDERVHRRGYGRTLLEALPPAARTDDFACVERFWAAQSGAVVPAAALASVKDVVEPALFDADVPF